MIATPIIATSRIQARAVRRMGELLKQFDGRGGDQSKSDGYLADLNREFAEMNRRLDAAIRPS